MPEENCICPACEKAMVKVAMAFHEVNENKMWIECWLCKECWVSKIRVEDQ